MEVFIHPRPRKARYDSKEVSQDRAKQILGRRQRNDSKPGGHFHSYCIGNLAEMCPNFIFCMKIFSRWAEQVENVW